FLREGPRSFAGPCRASRRLYVRSPRDLERLIELNGQHAGPMSARCLFMLKRLMHKRERHYAMLNDNRGVRPFEWGTEFLPVESAGSDPREVFANHTREVITASDE